PMRGSGKFLLRPDMVWPRRSLEGVNGPAVACRPRYSRPSRRSMASRGRPRYNRLRLVTRISDRTERTLSAVGFARLLGRLHSDPDIAAQEYERLRRTLVKFFDWRGAWPPEECADEA